MAHREEGPGETAESTHRGRRVALLGKLHDAPLPEQSAQLPVGVGELSLRGLLPGLLRRTRRCQLLGAGSPRAHVWSTHPTGAGARSTRAKHPSGEFCGPTGEKKDPTGEFYFPSGGFDTPARCLDFPSGAARLPHWVVAHPTGKPHWGEAHPPGKPHWGARDPSGVETTPTASCDWGGTTPLAETSGEVATPADTAVRGHLTRPTFLDRSIHPTTLY